MTSDPLDAPKPFTASEVALIRQYAPGMTRVDDEGNIIVTVTRAEIITRQLLYPSMNPVGRVPPAKSGSAGQDALAARYPTMFPTAGSR